MSMLLLERWPSPHLSWLAHLVEIIMILLYFIISLVDFSYSSVPYPCPPQQVTLYVIRNDHQPLDVMTFSVYCVEQSMQVEWTVTNTWVWNHSFFSLQWNEKINWLTSTRNKCLRFFFPIKRQCYAAKCNNCRKM